MKNLNKILLVSTLGLSLGAFAFVHHLGSGGAGSKLSHELHGWHQHGQRVSVEADSMARHLAEAFVQVALYDTDKDGALKAEEKAALASGISQGKVQFAEGHRPPASLTENTEKFMDHISEMYGQIAAYDRNRDGILDETEEETLRKAINAGELDFMRSRH
jgi:hypothetical protein